MIKTLRRKFIAIAMASIFLVLALIIGVINIANFQNVNQTADARLEILAANKGSFPLEDSLPDEDGDGFLRDDGAPSVKMHSSDLSLTAEAAYDTRYFTVTLYEDDGSVYSINTGSISAVSTSDAIAYAQALYEKGSASGFVGNYKYRAISFSNITQSQTLCMYIFLDCERELSTFRSFLISSLGISAAGLLVVFLLVLFFSRLALKPVEESYFKQKRFITDASHEIKTPLTIIDANTEILEMTEGENEWTQSIRNQIARLTGLTEKLVFLSRMDEENSALTMLDFSLSDAIAETAEPFVPVAQTHNRTLELDVAPNVTLNGDEPSIRRMISLLLDNAIKYSSEPGEIRLKLETNGRNKLITLWNTVDEITPGNQDILFDRFYRRDASRSQQTAGHGIGLSVVQAIVLSHRGKISAKSADGTSILFHISLP